LTIFSDLPARARHHTALGRGFIILGAVMLLLVLGVLAYLLVFVAPNLPSLDVITDYRPKIPLRVYTSDHALIGEFGEEHRDFVPIKQMPEMMKKALLSIEDKRFYDHRGIDFIGALGAARHNLGGGGLHGGSTITMQVARNFFLTRDKVYARKITEVALAYKIEAALSKDQILELYMNQIYLGQRSYGFGSAARTYFGKPIDKLSIAEMAMLAGLPQNPARHNPATNPKRARERQQLVLKQMQSLGIITDAQYQQALHEPLRVSPHGQQFETHAEYVAELARQAAIAQFKDDVYTHGIVVTTTIVKAEQDAAYESVRRNVIAYDQRHGYRGPEAFIDLPADADERDDAIDEVLQKRPSSDGLIAAVVTEASPKLVRVDAGGDNIDISGEGLRFAAPGLAPNARTGLKLRPGAVIRITQDARHAWSITQIPQVSAAFVSLDAQTGAYRAMVGGFDYNLQKFNHVTQAWRQPGSAIKPFIYASSLEKGYSPATRVNDAPLDLPGENAGATWSPQNDDNVFDGPITLRQALAHSKNVASVRLLREVTVPYAHEFIGKFGFDLARHPKNLTLALGTGAVTPLQMASAYSVFANGGYLLAPYLIASIADTNGKLVVENKAPAPNDEVRRVIDQRNAFVTDTMLRDVIRFGTGNPARQKLERADIAGKTGTTSDAMDGWFAGYGGGVVGVAWMGYDDPKSLGGREFGATLALPIWVDFMRVALAKVPVAERAVPEGVSQVDGDWLYSEYAADGAIHAIDIEDPPDAPAPAATH
jgi:penicillin-binding protein 1A